MNRLILNSYVDLYHLLADHSIGELLYSVSGTLIKPVNSQRLLSSFAKSVGLNAGL